MSRSEVSGKNEFRDLGFGTKLPLNKNRLLNHDGSFNVERRGIPGHLVFSAYQVMINISWPAFILVVFLSYVIANLIFSFLYLGVGIDHLMGHDGNSKLGYFWDAFFFSAQTLTTVGYGRISPQGVTASMLAALESLGGLMGFALASSLLYARFARPRAKLIFSRRILISPYRDGSGLMFRMANARNNQLIDTEVQVSLSLANPDGTRKFFDLSLERKMINFFPLSWTVVHPIDSESPLYGLNAESFSQGEGEFYVQVKAFDDTFGQTIYMRNSYTFAELIYGAKFAYIFSRSEKGTTVMDLHRLNEYEPAQLPATKQLQVEA
jgi:inward rectifier potassium channel